jgi:hypothetical protein
LAVTGSTKAATIRAAVLLSVTAKAEKLLGAMISTWLSFNRVQRSFTFKYGGRDS